MEWILSRLESEAVFIVEDQQTWMSARAGVLVDRFSAGAVWASVLGDATEITLNFSNPRSSSFREWSRDQSERFIIKRHYVGSVLFVLVSEAQSYDSLHRQLVDMATDDLPRGLSLIRLDLESALTTGVFGNQLYCDMFHITQEQLMAQGLVAITTNGLYEDYHLFDIVVPEYIKQWSDTVVVFRVVAGDRVAWIRQLTHFTWAGGSSIVGASVLENFAAGADAIARSLKGSRSEFMLSAITQSVFPIAVWVDAKLRITAASPATASLLAPSRDTVTGLPLELFVSLDQHKLKLRSFLRTRRDQNAPLVCRLRMNIGDRNLVQVDVFPFSMNGATIIGINPVDPIISLAKRRKRRSARAPATAGGPAERADEPSTAVINETFRWLFRDWFEAMTAGWAAVGPADWRVPTRIIAYQESVTNELILALPNYLQSEFLSASAAANYQLCAQLLSYTVYGDVNILGHPKQLTANLDLVQCVYRFFINMVSALSGDVKRQHALLMALSESRKTLIVKKLTKPLCIMLNLGFALTLLSAANKNPANFSDSLPWLRAAFADALETPPLPQIDEGRKLPVMYWLCILWASFMHAIGRAEEARGLLSGTLEELEAYTARHPRCLMTAQQLDLVRYNLAITAPFASTIPAQKGMYYCGGDQSWCLSTWRRDCMHATPTGFCCTTHLLTGSSATRMVVDRDRQHVNAALHGTDHKDCLVKRFDCSNYLFARDVDFINWADEYFTDILRPQPGLVRVSEKKFESSLAPDAKEVHITLQEGDSLDDMRAIITRTLAQEGLVPCWDELSEVSSEELTDDDDDLNPGMFIFTIELEWSEVTHMRDFAPDPRYSLARLEDGNLLRVTKESVGTGLLVRRCLARPVEKVDVDPLEILNHQIYIYQCMDGYYEYELPARLPGSKFPFRNAPDETCVGADELRAAVAQMYNAMQVRLVTDPDRGAEILDYIFSDELLYRLESVVDAEGEDTDTDSDCPEQEMKQCVSTVRRMPTTAGTYRRAEDREPSFVMDENGGCESGVKGVYWNKPHGSHYFGVCHHYYIRSLSCRGGPSKSHDPKCIEEACNVAIKHLREVAEPEIARLKANAAAHHD